MDVAGTMKSFFSGNKGGQQQSPAQGGSTLENAQGNVGQHQQTSGAAQVGDTNKPATPMASFDKLWETDATKTGAKPAGVLPEITAEQLTATLANSNFLHSVSPELLAKAAGGDATAFGDVINQGLRTVMAQSVLASRGLVEAGTRSHGEQLRTSLPTMVRSSNVSDSLQANPLYSNPAVKPVIDNVRRQLEEKNPTASAKEIADLTDSYFADLTKAMRGSSDEGAAHAAGGQAKGEINWYKELGLE